MCEIVFMYKGGRGHGVCHLELKWLRLFSCIETERGADTDLNRHAGDMLPGDTVAARQGASHKKRRANQLQEVEDGTDGHWPCTCINICTRSYVCACQSNCMYLLSCALNSLWLTLNAGTLAPNKTTSALQSAANHAHYAQQTEEQKLARSTSMLGVKQRKR